MTDQPVRTHVVALLLRVRPDTSRPVSEWTYTNGRRLTAQDAATVAGATHADVVAADRIMSARALDAELAAHTAERVRDLLAPYWRAHPECRTLQELAPHLTRDDAETLAVLARMGSR